MENDLLLNFWTLKTDNFKTELSKAVKNLNFFDGRLNNILSKSNELSKISEIVLNQTKQKRNFWLGYRDGLIKFHLESLPDKLLLDENTKKAHSFLKEHFNSDVKENYKKGFWDGYLALCMSDLNLDSFPDLYSFDRELYHIIGGKLEEKILVLKSHEISEFELCTI